LKNIFNQAVAEKEAESMDIVGQLQEGMARFSAQESRVAAFILQNLSFTPALRLMNWRCALA